MDIPLSVQRVLADFPFSWRQKLYMLSEEDPGVFWVVLLRMCKYHRARTTGNDRALESLRWEEEKASREVSAIFTV